MPHSYRHQNFGPSDYQRGGRMRSGTARDRYASGNERRYSADWDEQPGSGGFEGDRSYSAGGYAEEFGHRRPGSRDLERGQGQRGGDYGSPGRWEQERWTHGEEPWQARREEDVSRESRARYEAQYRYPRQMTDEDNPDFRSPQRGRTRGPSLLAWDDDPQDLGAYYGTGNYYGAYGTQPSARAEGMRAYGGGYFNDMRTRWNAPQDEWNQRDSVSGRTWGYAGGFERSQGQYRGRGPKGYERSDERLREMICERLTDDPRIDASDVSLEVKDKVVKLSGTVQERRTKYLIEDIVESCGAVKDIENSLRVRSAWHTSRAEDEQEGGLASAQRGATSKGSPSSSKRSQS